MVLGWEMGKEILQWRALWAFARGGEVMEWLGWWKDQAVWMFGEGLVGAVEAAGAEPWRGFLVSGLGTVFCLAGLVAVFGGAVVVLVLGLRKSIWSSITT